MEISSTMKTNKTWKAMGTYDCFKDADDARSAFIADGKEAKIRKRHKKGVFDVVVCV